MKEEQLHWVHEWEAEPNPSAELVQGNPVSRLPFKVMTTEGRRPERSSLQREAQLTSLKVTVKLGAREEQGYVEG